MNRLTPILFLLLCCFFSLKAEPVLQALDYTDNLEIIDNPHIGFYRPVVKHFLPEGNTNSNTWGNLTHLRMDISAFSDKAVISKDPLTYGVSQPLTEEMLTTFEAMLDNVRSRGASAIVRFSYDPWYGGTSKCDPDQSIILNHLRQLGEVYARNTDVITFVELGMYGSWGEMHSSNNGSNENIAEALQTLLACTPPEIKVGVRRPDIIAYWLGVADGSDYSDFDIYSDRFMKAVEAKGDTIYRVGMYNDGYLGSSSDLGTIGMGSSGHQLTREMMVNWLNRYCQHTPYGGELVANYNGDHPINTPTYLSGEGFLTHTSYLNHEWHQPTILGWKDSTYSGIEEEYNGQDGFTYVANHLGYRFLLRNSYLPESVCQEGALPLQFTVENVGFGNLTKQKKVTFVLSDGMNHYEISPDVRINPMDWLSRTTTEVETSLTLPKEIETGEYKVYIRISEKGQWQTDNNLYTIRFGNPIDQFLPAFGGNLLGEISVVKPAETDITNLSSDKQEPYCIYKDHSLVIRNCESVLIHSMDGKLLFQMSGMTTELVIPITIAEPIIVSLRSRHQAYRYYLPQ